MVEGEKMLDSVRIFFSSGVDRRNIPIVISIHMVSFCGSYNDKITSTSSHINAINLRIRNCLIKARLEQKNKSEIFIKTKMSSLPFEHIRVSTNLIISLSVGIGIRFPPIMPPIVAPPTLWPSRVLGPRVDLIHLPGSLLVSKPVCQS